MASTKNQHYVPQYYLRHFSPEGTDGRCVGMFHRKTGRIFPSASIKDQCSKDWLYGKGDTERTLGLLESKTAALLNQIVNQEALPRPTSQDHGFLAQAVMFQRARTLGAADYDNELLRQFGGHILPPICAEVGLADMASEFELELTDPVLFAMSHQLHLWPALMDLAMVLLKNVSKEGFVVSDNPIVFYNLFLEAQEFGNVGFQSVGLHIYFPLTPDYSILFYDPATYTQVKKGPFLHLSAPKDILNLNSLATLNSRHSFYFNPRRTTADYLKHLWERVGPANATAGAKMKVFVQDEFHRAQENNVFVAEEDMEPGFKNKPRREILLSGRQVPSLNLVLSFLKIRPSRLQERGVFASQTIPRNPWLAQAFEAFENMVTRGKHQPHEFLDFLQDLEFRRKLHGSSSGFPWR